MIKRIFQNPAIPRELQSNFIHLYFDIGWFGVLSGSAVNFLTVYAVRLGASPTQIGLLGSTAAAVTLFIAIPAGRWLETQNTARAVFWTSVLYRLGYLAWVFIPWFLGEKAQVWALIGITLLMGFPLTYLGLGFSALFAEAVPDRWRAYVTGIRNVAQAVTFMLTSLASGYILDHTPFPQGYQIIFFIGFIGAAMSSVHLYFVKPAAQLLPTNTTIALPPVPRTPRPKATENWRAALRTDIWKTKFRKVLLVLLGFHLAQYLAIPIFPLYMVNELHLNDGEIGIGTAFFYLTVLLTSTQLARMARRANHKTITGIGAIGMSIYPILMAFSTNTMHYYGLSILGGFSWALVGGAYLNYVLEHIPENDRPAHLAWYNIILNACVLAGSLLGPAIAIQTGLSAALIGIGILRGLTGLAILKLG